MMRALNKLIILFFLLVAGSAQAQFDDTPPANIPAIGAFAPVCGTTAALAVQSCNEVGKRAPLPTDDMTKGYVNGNHWTLPSLNQDWLAINNTASGNLPAGNALWLNSFPGNAPFLDVEASLGQQFLGWWGTQLVTRNANVVAYNKAVDIWRNSDGTTQTFGWAASGDIDAAALDAFCFAATSCEISKAYDQAFNITTGVMSHNDETQTPGFFLSTATVSTGGACTPDGAYTFNLNGGATGSVSALISGTVTGGALAGALTVSSAGSYTQYPTAISPAVTAVSGGTCATAPTINQGMTQGAPLWTTNVVNGHRSFTFSSWYGGGNQYGVGGAQGSTAGLLINVAEFLAWPNTMTPTIRTSTLFFSGQLPQSIFRDNTLATLGSPINGFKFQAATIGNPANSCGALTNIPSPSFFCTQNTTAPLNPTSSPAVWSFVTGISSTAVNIGNQSGTIPVSLASGTSIGGRTGAGGIGLGDVSNFDMLGQGIASVSVPSAAVSAGTSALNIQGGMTPQTNIDLIIVADSQIMGQLSTTGESIAKYLTQLNLLNAKVNVTNISYLGGQYAAGGYNYTANFTANWLPLCNPLHDQYVFLNLGVNDIGTGASSATTYTRAQAYATLLATNCPTIKMIQGTLPYKTISSGGWTSANATSLAAYNVQVLSSAMQPIASGGLGAYGVIDLGNDPLFSQGQNTVINYAIQQSGHLNVAGSVDEAWSLARGLNALIK